MDSVIILGVVLFLHLIVTVLGASVMKRKYKFWGNTSFGSHAHQIGVIFTILGLALLFAGNIVFKTIPTYLDSREIFDVVYFGSAAFAIFVISIGLITEVLRRIRELGIKGVTLRMVAAGMTSAVLAYMMIKMGIAQNITEIQLFAIYGINLSFSIQVA